MDDKSADPVEVVYALPDEAVIVEVPYSPELTAIEAVERSGLPEKFPEIASRPLVLGVFGERVELNARLGPGARVEICRPLQQDPREMRWELAQQGNSMGRRRNDADD